MSIVEKALERLRRATEYDAAGDVAHAVDEYDAGVVLLARAMVAEKDAAMKKTLCDKCGEYGARADQLRAALAATPAATAAAKKEEPAITKAEMEMRDLEERIARLPALGRPVGAARAGAEWLDAPKRTEEEQVDDILRAAIESAAIDRKYGVKDAGTDDEEEERKRKKRKQARAAKKAAKMRSSKPRRRSSSSSDEDDVDDDESDDSSDFDSDETTDTEDEDDELDEETARKVFLASHKELEAALRQEDPEFTWDSYDLPPSFRTGTTAQDAQQPQQQKQQEAAAARKPDRQRTMMALRKYLHGRLKNDPMKERERLYMERREREEWEKEQAAYEKWARKQLGVQPKKKK